MTDDNDNLSDNPNNNHTSENRQPYQASKYLGSCVPIVQAWHQRLLEIKNKAKVDETTDDEPIEPSADNQAYLSFFRTAISASDAAKLKRCQHMDDVAMQPAFIALWQQVSVKLTQDKHADYSISNNTFAAWMAVAWVLAQVRSVDARYRVETQGKSNRLLDNSLGRVAGQHQDERPLISSLRFEKLISARRPDDFVTLLARIVALLQSNQKAQPLNIILLANDILHWFADHQGNNHRHPRDKLTVQWSLDYYQANNL